MFNVIASFEAKGDAAQWVAPEKAACYAHAPLIASALVL